MPNIKLLAAELAFRADRKILQMEEEPYYRMDIAAHEKIANPWIVKFDHTGTSAMAFLPHLSIKEIVHYFGLSSLIFAFLFILTNTPAYTKILLADIMDSRESAEAISTPDGLNILNATLTDVNNSQKNANTALLKPLEEAAIKPADGILPLNLPIASYDNRISIPSLNINVPLVSPKLALNSLKSQDWNALEEQIRDSLQKGVVYYPGTAEPGAKGNFFVTGHSSNYFWELSPYNTVFALLPKVQPGADIYVNYNQNSFHYKVTSKVEVKPEDVSILKQGDSHKMTLMTCTPVGTTLKRLVVSADLVE